MLPQFVLALALSKLLRDRCPAAALHEVLTLPRRASPAPRATQFKKGKKRARAQEEAEAMYLAGANSALCIALAKMHMTLAVEQVQPGPACAAAGKARA